MKRAPQIWPVLAMTLGAVCLNVRPAPADDGKVVYEQNCAACHGVTGKGDGPAGRLMKPPPGTFATSAKAQNEADVARVITAGTPHPTFAKKLSDKQVRAVASYVKSIASH